MNCMQEQFFHDCVLLACVCLLLFQDLGKAIERDLRQSVSQSGNSVQRVGFQFLRALKVRAATTEVEQLFQSPSHLQKVQRDCRLSAFVHA